MENQRLDREETVKITHVRLVTLSWGRLENHCAVTTEVSNYQKLGIHILTSQVREADLLFGFILCHNFISSQKLLFFPAKTIKLSLRFKHDSFIFEVFKIITIFFLKYQH